MNVPDLAPETKKALEERADERMEKLQRDPFHFIDPQCDCAVHIRQSPCHRQFHSAVYCHNRQVDYGMRRKLIPDLSTCDHLFRKLFVCLEKHNLDLNVSEMQKKSNGSS